MLGTPAPFTETIRTSQPARRLRPGLRGLAKQPRLRPALHNNSTERAQILPPIKRCCNSANPNKRARARDRERVRERTAHSVVGPGDLVAACSRGACTAACTIVPVPPPAYLETMSIGVSPTELPPGERVVLPFWYPQLTMNISSSVVVMLSPVALFTLPPKSMPVRPPGALHYSRR